MVALREQQVLLARRSKLRKQQQQLQGILLLNPVKVIQTEGGGWQDGGLIGYTEGVFDWVGG